MLTPDMRAVIRAAHLCFAATVTADGRPNVSPKGTLGVWDAHHLFFLDLASPNTRANLARQPFLELNVVEQLSRRGYRFSGPATLYGPESFEYGEAVKRVYGDTTPAAAPAAMVMLTVDRVAPLLSPAYWRGLDETTLRAQWAARRAALDAEFEAYLAEVEPVRIPERPSA
jgi:predicted pyridoxine 5'-phosphate oxidase superfamily flavin-nucleotide-binding protein